MTRGHYLWFLNILFFATSTHNVRAEKITLEQAKKYAIRKNYHLESLRQQRAALVADLEILRTNFLPKLALLGGLNSYGEVIREITPTGFFQLEYNLFNQNIDQMRLELAKIKIEKAELLLKKESFFISLAVENVFHTYVYLHDLVELQMSSLKMNNTHKTLVSKTKNAGLSSATDVMEFQLKDAILSSDLELLQHQLEESRISLKTLLGEELGSKLTPIGSIQHQHLKGNLMSYLDQIRSKNTQILSATLDLQEIHTKNSLWRSSWLPKIDLNFKAGQLPAALRERKNEIKMEFLLTFNYEFFSGFKSQYELKKQRALTAKSENILKAEILTSVANVEKSFRKLKTIERRVDLEENNVHRSTIYYKGIKKEYLRGYKNSADLASAAEKYIESKKRKIEFMFDFLSAKIKLERTLGAKIEVEVID